MTDTTTEGPTGGGMAAAARLFALAALGLGGYGLYGMMTLSEADELLGGDAYNYIVDATRGVGWISAGVLLGVLAVCFAVLSTRRPQ